MQDTIGPIEILVSGKLIDSLYKNGTEKHKLQEAYPINTYFVLRSLEDPQKTVLAKLCAEDTFKRLMFDKNFDLSGIKPRDARQYFLSEAFLSRDNLISVGLGPAGTGKTTLAVAYALEKVFQGEMKLHMCKPTALVGELKNTFGPVPGTIDEKYAPHIGHFNVILENILGDKSKAYIKLLIEKGSINFTPLEYTRGMTFKDCIFVMDEVQNLSWHELKTICSRIGENSKLILLGDPEQIDRKFPLQKSGIYHMLKSKAFQQSPLTSSVFLTTQYRGPIAELITDIDHEYRDKKSERTISK